MKTKRKFLVAGTIAASIGWMVAGATLTANAMGTTSDGTKVSAVVGTVRLGPDGKSVIACSFNDIDLPSIAAAPTADPGPAVPAVGTFQLATPVPLDEAVGGGPVNFFDADGQPIKAADVDRGEAPSGPAVAIEASAALPTGVPIGNDPAASTAVEVKAGTDAECAAMKPGVDATSGRTVSAQTGDATAKG